MVIRQRGVIDSCEKKTRPKPWMNTDKSFRSGFLLPELNSIAVDSPEFEDYAAVEKPPVI